MKTRCSITFILFVVIVILSITVNAQVNLNNGLVGYFSFDNNALDQSSVGVNGTAHNTVLTTGKTNNPNGAYLFNGVNSYIDCSSNLRSISNTVTISAWVKTTNIGLQFIVGKYDWTVDKGFHLFIQNGSAHVAGRNNGGLYVNTNNSNSANIMVADGNWHFVMAEVSGNSWKVWVDCVLNNSVTSNSSVPSLINTKPLSIGNYLPGTPTGNQLFFNGKIDEVRIYNRTLTVAERTLLCDINFMGLFISEPLVSNDTAVCVGSSVTLFATPDTGMVYWESPLGTIIDSGNIHVDTITQSVDFYVYSVLNGITSSNSVISVTALNVDTAITQNGFTLTATQNGVAYQWIDCENWTLMPGVISQSFTPAITGYYALAVTNGNCSDTSRCFYVGAVGVEEIANANNLKVYPNPVEDELTIESITNYSILSVELMDVSGKSIATFKGLSTKKMKIELSNYATGIYYVRVQMQNEFSIIKVVKAK